MILNRVKKFFRRIRGFGENEYDIIEFASSLVIKNPYVYEELKPYPIQKKLLRHIQKNRFSICKASRQSGKTLTSIVYILYVLFHCSDTSVVIIGHNYASSLHILKRIREIFLESSIFEKNGIKIVLETYDRIQFSNGSFIEVRSATPPKFKGSTYDIVILDEYAFFSEDQIYYIENEIFPRSFSQYNTKIIIFSSLESWDFMNAFNKLYDDALKGINQFSPFLIRWSDIPGRNRKWRKLMKRSIGKEAFAKEYECYSGIFGVPKDKSLKQKLLNFIRR